MNDPTKKESYHTAWMLILLLWLVYTTSYLGKLNYSANITQIIDSYGITKAQAGIVPTFFFFAYGIGQVFNGLLCNKYNLKWMIFISLFVSGLINLFIAITTEFWLVKWLWMINGFVLSILWPSIMRILSDSLPQKYLGTSSVFLGSTVPIGTLLIYGLSAVYALFDNFKLAFYTAAFCDIIVSVVWLSIYTKSVMYAKAEKESEEKDIQINTATAKSETSNIYHKNNIIFLTVYIVCFFVVGVNLTKDGLMTWVPSILKEEFALSDSLSILLTLFLPILAIFGNAWAVTLHKKIPDYVTHSALLFAIIGIFIGFIIGSLKFELASLMLVGLIAANFLATSLNSLITSIFPLYMRDKLNSGRLAGIINGFAYLGSTISSYGLGIIADNFGWNGVFITLLIFCALVMLVWTGYLIFKRCSKNED
ncbi:MAG: MFS transporter [Ruminococcaceae bacterium]|nr:MFS transporter [Oscillospiraceae bacterium]